MAGGMAMLGIASLLTVASLVMLSISFATDNWLLYIVNRDALLSNPDALNSSLCNNTWYYSQNRGLFRTCYESGYLTFGSDNCIPEYGYELDNNPRQPRDSYYQIRIHLIRTHWAFFVAAIALLLFAAIFSAVACKSLTARTLQGTAILTFMAAFFIAGGMAFFHGYDYLEKQKIYLCSFRYYIWQDATYNSFVRGWSYWMYGYSYILGWISMATSALGAVVYLRLWSTKQPVRTVGLPGPARFYNQENDFSSLSRNKAYDYLDRGLDRGRYPEDVIYSAYPVPADPFGGFDGMYDYGGYGGYRY